MLLSLQLLNLLAAAPPAQPDLIAIKPSTTARSSTTTYADDPHLSIVVLASGSYGIQLFMPCNVSSGSGGFKAQIVYSGTISDSVGYTVTVPPSPAAISTHGDNGPLTGPAFSIGATLATSPSLHVLEMHGVIRFADTGTLSLQWAQVTSNAGASNLLARAYIRLTKLS